MPVGHFPSHTYITIGASLVAYTLLSPVTSPLVAVVAGGVIGGTIGTAAGRMM